MGLTIFLGGLVRDCGMVGRVIPNIELEKLMIDQKVTNIVIESDLLLIVVPYRK